MNQPRPPERELAPNLAVSAAYTWRKSTDLTSTQLLSGFVFPIESMPVAIQWVTVIVPARWFVTIARGIMLKGSGLTYLWRETLVLVAMTVVLLVASVKSFKVRLQ